MKATPKSKVQPGSISVSPQTGYEGDRIVFHLATPVRGLVVPRILIGGKPLEAPMLRDRFTLVGQLPADKPGKKQVSLEEKGSATRSTETTITHQGQRPVERGERAWRSILHYGHEDGGGGYIYSDSKLGNAIRPGSNWWMLGANPYHDGNVQSIVNTPLTTVWQRPAPDVSTFGYAEPVLSGDTLFLAPFTPGGGQEVFAALDVATGSRIWSWNVSRGRGRIDASPLCVNGRVYVVQLIADAGIGALHLICGDVGNGSIVWERALGLPTDGGSYVHLAAAHDLIYVMTYDGSLRAFNAVTGALVWERIREIPLTLGVGSDQSMALAYGSLVVGSANGLRTFDPMSGEPTWFSPIVFDCSYSPIVVTTGVNPPLVIAGDEDGMLHAFNAFTKQHVWQFQAEVASQFFWPRMACNLQRLYLMQYRTVLALDLATGRVLATSPNLGGPTSGAPTVCANRVFQLTAQYGGDPAGANRLLGLDLDNLSIIDHFEVHPTRMVRPVVLRDQLYLNVSTAVTSTASMNVIQAVRISV